MSSFKWIANSLKNLRISGTTTAGGQNVQARLPHTPSPNGQKVTQAKSGVPEKPMKRPVSPFIKYATAIRSEVATQNPGKKPTEIMKLCSQRWAELDKNEKDKLSVEFKKESENYSKVMEKYNESLTPEQKNAIEQEKTAKALKRDKLARKKLLDEMKKPKKPMSSFLLFLSSQQSSSPSTTGEAQQRVKVLSEKWRSMSDQEKAPFYEKYQQHMEEYSKVLSKWEAKMIRMGYEDLVRPKAVSKQ